MSSKIGLLFVAVTLAIALFNAPAARACSCAGKQTVLAEYEWANVVVVARVLSVEKLGEGDEYRSVRSTRMIVETVFKGNLKVGDEMTFAQGGGADCIWTFEEKDIGTQYLFYLHAREKEQTYWLAGTCGRSRQVAYAADDLLYLENLEKVRGKTRLSGTFSFSQASATEDSEPVYRRLDGRKIRIIGEKKTYEAVTNADGVYEIYNLPAGTYILEPELADGWKISSHYSSHSPKAMRSDKEDSAKPAKQEFRVVIEAGKHTYSDFSYAVNNVVRGKIFDTAGNPMKSVCVRLVPAQGKVSRYFYKADCTEADGVFEMTEVPPGSYLIVINSEDKISSREPFRTFYYPNVFEREKAGVITLGAGDLREGLNIYVPKMEETITVEGVCLFSDNKPASEVWIKFKADKSTAGIDDEARTQSDANGHFSIKILKGLTGTLHSELYAYTGMLENCPKLDELIRKSGRDRGTIKTNTVDIQAEKPLPNVRLQFAFPFCRKAKSSY
jgi:hypothetical protein